MEAATGQRPQPQIRGAVLSLARDDPIGPRVPKWNTVRPLQDNQLAELHMRAVTRENLFLVYLGHMEPPFTICTEECTRRVSARGAGKLREKLSTKVAHGQMRDFRKSGSRRHQ